MRSVQDQLRRRGRSLSWLGILPACIFIGCGASLVSSDSADQRALETWKQQEAVVELAIEGQQPNEDAFVAACLFFERLTGISIHVQIYTFGFLPEAEAARDLALGIRLTLLASTGTRQPTL